MSIHWWRLLVYLGNIDLGYFSSAGVLKQGHMLWLAQAGEKKRDME